MLEQAATEIGRIAALAADPSLAPVLRSPLLAAGRRRELVQMLAREMHLSDLLKRFLSLLADQQRLGELPTIAEHFRDMLDRELGRVRMTIRTAAALDPQQQSEIVAAFAKLTAKEIIPRVAVDPELLGGVVVEVEGKVYDGTVRTHLHRLAKELTGTAVL